MNQASAQRLFYFDNARGIASILGVFYHVALIFSYPWHVNIDPENFLPATEFFIEYLNVARMPLFLFISGFFAMYSLKKYRERKFLRRRIQRILVPLITGILIIVPLQQFIEEPNISLGQYLDIIFPFDDDFHLSHLWFLYHIYLFSLVLIVFYYLPSYFKKIIKRMISLLNRNVILAIGFWSLLMIVGHFAGRTVDWIISSDNDLLRLSKMGRNIPVFLFGAYTFLNMENMGKNCLTGKWKEIIFSGAIYTGIVILFQLIEPSLNLKWVLYLLMTFSLTVLWLNLIYKFLNFTNPLLRFISDASYAFYILHHPVIIILGMLYLKIGSSSILLIDYFILCFISILVTYFIYYFLVMKNRVGNFLITGFLKQEDKIRVDRLWRRNLRRKSFPGNRIQ